jgi:hypothetical protein
MLKNLNFATHDTTCSYYKRDWSFRGEELQFTIQRD